MAGGGVHSSPGLPAHAGAPVPVSRAPTSGPTPLASLPFPSYQYFSATVFQATGSPHRCSVPKRRHILCEKGHPEMSDPRPTDLNRLANAHQAVSAAMQTVAARMPLALSFPVDAAGPIRRSGGFCSQQERVRRGLQARVDPESPESRLGTDDDVFTFASTFRYRPGSIDPTDPSGVGLFYGPAVESPASPDPSTATPFDTGGVFEHLRPHDAEADQIQFVRDHELPVPDYRDLLARYLCHCFDHPTHYLADRGPNGNGRDRSPAKRRRANPPN